MKTNHSIAVWLLLGALFQVQHAAAEAIHTGGSITFSGEIIEKTCVIDGEPYFTVPLPSVVSSRLDTHGKREGETEFHIRLSECGKIGGGVRARFDIAPERAKRLTIQALSPEHAMAENVEIELEHKQPKGLILTDQHGPYYMINEHGEADLVYVARYFSTSKVKAGKVHARTTYILEYQ